MKLLTFLLFPLIIFLFIAQTVSAQSFPKPVGYVNDFADLYSQAFEARLEEDLKVLETSTSAEIAVVTVPDLQETTIDDYAVRLFENWKIGKRGKDNGVLVLITKKEREVRIEIGYGLEGAITDARAGRIIREQMVPSFKEGNYEQGTENAVTILKKYIRGESVPEESESPPVDLSGWTDIIPFIFFGLIYLGSFLARSKAYYAGGIIGGIVGIAIGIFVGGLAAILSVGVVSAIIGLVLDYILSHNYQYLRSHHKRTDWWGSGGGFYGTGRSGGGFGGFGGGSSGGGGASGRW